MNFIKSRYNPFGFRNVTDQYTAVRQNKEILCARTDLAGIQIRAVLFINRYGTVGENVIISVFEY